ncbi:MAG: long-chain fatty acid--CoA ligase [bacterium]
MEARPWHDQYDPGVRGTIEIREVTLPELLREAAHRHGGLAALRFLNCEMTYEQLDGEVDRLAGTLRSLGVNAGDRVAIQLPNLPQTVISFFAVLRAGAVAVMTNPLYTPREIEQQWNDAGCRVAITMDFLFASTLVELAERVPVEQWIVASIPEYLRFPLNLLAPLKLRREKLLADVPDRPDVHRFLDAVERGAPEPFPDGPSFADLAALQYTGGTTGRAKGAMLTHGNLSSQVQQLRNWMPHLETGQETFLSALPFFHVFGLTVGMTLPISLASTLVLVPNPREIKRLVESINKYRVTVFPVVPAMVNGINAHPAAKSLRVDSLKLCVSGSAPLPEDTLRRFEELTGGRLVEGYGLTEASPVTHVNPATGKRRVNWIGLPLPETDCRLASVTDPDQPAGPGEAGELLIRGPQVMAGYWNRPDASAETLRDGWLHTGDLAEMDADGWFRIVGRKKEIIICGGYKVYPDEIDRVLMEHPDIVECATIGVPDEKRGETPKSFVVLRPGAKLTAEQVEQHCRADLAAYKIPRQIEFRSELPKSSVLKILRRVLVEEELAKRKSA